MTAKLFTMRRFLPLLLLLPVLAAAIGQTAPALTPVEAQALVERVLATELNAAQDASHPMRFELRKTSPRLTQTKDIVETKDGAVARLAAINDKPLSPEDESKEQARLDGLLSDPGKQRHRKQSEEEDRARALKVLRALPRAFLYTFEGPASASGVTVETFSFRPNPEFTPPDLETMALTEMTGKLSIDTAHGRVTQLEGTLRNDVDFGWGILGRLDKGGTVEIAQADVGGGQWRVVRFKMVMTGRLLFKTKAFDTAEEETKFAPVPVGLGYEKAIEILRESMPPGGQIRR